MILEKLFPNTTERQKDALRLMEASLLIILGLFVYVFLPQKIARRQQEQKYYRGPVMQSSIEAYSLAVKQAKQWDDDPKLVKINSSGGTVDQDTGKSTFFRVWFADADRDAGYEVLIQEGQFKQSGEFVLYRKGAELPPSLMSEEEAIAQLHAIPGYENEEILSTELVYEETSAMWYWGIKTKDHGVVTFEAEKN